MSRKKLWIIFIIAAVVRLLLSAISFHPDIQAFAMGNWVISQGHIGSFYDFLSTLKIPSNFQQYPPDFFIYPPAIYFYHSLFYFLYSPFLSSQEITNFIFNVTSGLGHFQFNLELIFLKIPYMIFDLPAAYFFSKLFDEKKSQNLGLLFWLFNPVSLYATYLMGQFDIIPTSIVIFSLFVLYRQKKIWGMGSRTLAAILLGLGAAFKIYPVFLLVALVSLSESWRERIKLLIYGFLAYLITVIPFLFSHGFRSSALLAGLTTKSLYAQIPISGGESILLFEGILLFFYLIFLSRRTLVENLWQRFFIILLVFFIFTHYHPQWFVWLSPFLVLDLIKSNFKNILAVFLSLFSFVSLLFFFDPSLTLGLFAPVSPGLHTVPTLWSLLHLNLDQNFSRSVLQTIFVGSAVYFLYLYFPKKVDS